jgi:hypothetical protein
VKLWLRRSKDRGVTIPHTFRRSGSRATIGRTTKKGGGERLVKTITREELKAKMDRGDDFVLLEVLGEASYRRGHLPGAIRLQDTGAAAEVVPDREAFVVAYCSNFN